MGIGLHCYAGVSPLVLIDCFVLLLLLQINICGALALALSLVPRMSIFERRVEKKREECSPLGWRCRADCECFFGSVLAGCCVLRSRKQSARILPQKCCTLSGPSRAGAIAESNPAISGNTTGSVCPAPAPRKPARLACPWMNSRKHPRSRGIWVCQDWSVWGTNSLLLPRQENLGLRNICLLKAQEPYWGEKVGNPIQEAWNGMGCEQCGLVLDFGTRLLCLARRHRAGDSDLWAESFTSLISACQAAVKGTGALLRKTTATLTALLGDRCSF